LDLSSFIRQAVIEEIEDEYDLALFHKVWEEEKGNERVTQEAAKKRVRFMRRRVAYTSVFIIPYIEKNLVDCTHPRKFGKCLEGNLKDKWRCGS